MKAYMKSLKNLNVHKGGKYSQNGEAGILDELLKRLNITGGVVVEFGANDGYWFSNTIHLIEKGNWLGYYLEPHYTFKQLKELSKSLNIVAMNNFVVTENRRVAKNSITINELFETIGNHVDVLSIDIDSYDYDLFEELQHRPSIVIIEINAYMPPPLEIVYKDGNVNGGSSFSSFLRLAKHKGYVPVACTGNIFLVAEELCDGYELPNRDMLFDWSFINNDGIIINS